MIHPSFRKIALAPLTPRRGIPYTARPDITPSMPKTAMPLPAITMVIMGIIDLIDIGATELGDIVDGDFDVIVQAAGVTKALTPACESAQLETHHRRAMRTQRRGL